MFNNCSELEVYYLPSLALSKIGSNTSSMGQYCCSSPFTYYRAPWYRAFSEEGTFNDNCFFQLQRVPQLVRPDQGPCVGRGQRPEVKATAKVHPRVRWLLGADHHRGPDLVRRDGRVVQPGEEVGQVERVRSNPAPDQRRDQGRGKGESSTAFFTKAKKNKTDTIKWLKALSCICHCAVAFLNR